MLCRVGVSAPTGAGRLSRVVEGSQWRVPIPPCQVRFPRAPYLGRIHSMGGVGSIGEQDCQRMK
jgi:hypothetical protein